MRSRSGFTLVEVMVALAVGSAAILGAHAAFGSALDTVARLDARRSEVETALRGRRWLVRVCGSLDASSPGSIGFTGSPHEMRFAARMRDSTGTFALVPLRLRAVDGWLVAEHLTPAGSPATAESLLLSEDVVFDYLLEGGAEARWVSGWHSPISAPVAIRIRVARAPGAMDTLLLAVGVRG